MPNLNLLAAAGIQVVRQQHLPRFSIYTVRTDDLFDLIVKVKGAGLQGHNIVEPTNSDNYFTIRTMN